MFSFIYKRTVLRAYKINYAGVLVSIAVILMHSAQAKEPFSYTAYNVDSLYSEALQYMDNKEYDKAIERLLVCQGTTRCASLLSDIYQLDDPAIRDINKSVHYQEILFENGFKQAYHNIGYLYEKNKNK